MIHQIRELHTGLQYHPLLYHGLGGNFECAQCTEYVGGNMNDDTGVCFDYFTHPPSGIISPSLTPLSSSSDPLHTGQRIFTLYPS